MVECVTVETRCFASVCDGKFDRLAVRPFDGFAIWLFSDVALETRCFASACGEEWEGFAVRLSLVKDGFDLGFYDCDELCGCANYVTSLCHDHLCLLRQM